MKESVLRQRSGIELLGGTKGIAIHFADYPTLAKYHCPEGSHLDARDAGPFTRALADVIRTELQE